MFNNVIRYSIRVFVVLIVLFLLVIGGVSTYLYLNKEKLYQEVITSLNETQVGKTYIDEIQISPFRNFPYISIDVKNLRFFASKNYGETEQPVYAFDDVYVGFDVWDLLAGNFTIKKILATNGSLRLEKYQDGHINLLLAKDSMDKKSEEEEPDSDFSLNLENITLKNVLFEYVDYANFNFFSLNIEDAKSKFSMGKEKIQIHVDLKIMLNDYSNGGKVIFADKYFELHNDLIYHNEREFLEIFPGDFVLENGHLDFEGSIDFLNDVDLNLLISGRKKNFETFLYFAPDDIFRKLKQFKNEGDIYLKGEISGPVLNQPPAINIELGCINTFFFHENNTEAIKDLNFKGIFTTGAENNLRTAELYFENLSGLPENGEFRGSFRVTNFLDPVFEVDFHADLDLADIKSFYDLEELRESRGNLLVDIKFFEYIDTDSVIQVATRLDDNSRSKIVFKDAYFDFSTYHKPVSIDEGKIEFEGDGIKLDKLHVKAGDNDMVLSLNATNLSSLIHATDKTIDLVMKGQSKRLNVKELLPKEMDNDSLAFLDDTITNLYFDFDLHANSEKLKNFEVLPEAVLNFRDLRFELKKYPYPLRQFKGKVRSSDEELSIDELFVNLGFNDLYLDGHLYNPKVLAQENVKQQVKYDFTVKANKIDLKELLVYDGRSLMSEELDAEIEQELIRKLHFEGDGNFVSNSFCPNGFLSETNIRKFNVVYNDMPYVEKVRGKIKTDTTGCVHVDSFTATIGNSDINLNLKMEHFLDSNLVNKKIIGNLSSNMLDLDQLFSYQEPSKNEEIDHDSAFNVFVLPFPNMELELDIKKFRHHKYIIEDITGKLRTTENHYVYFDDFKLLAADGKVEFKGCLNGENHENVYLTSTLKLHDIDLDKVFYKFDNFGQDAMVNDNLHGRIDATIESTVRMHTDFTPYLNNTDAHIEVVIRDGIIENFTPLLAMSDFMGDKNLNRVRFGELENTLDFKNGVLTIPKMQIASTLGYIYLNGTHSLDMDMDYEMKIPLSLIKSSSWNLMKSKLKVGKGRKKDVEDLEEEIIKEQKGLVKGYATFTVKGHIDDFSVAMGKRK
jgi:hypothetical protein